MYKVIHVDINMHKNYTRLYKHGYKTLN